MIQKLDDTNIEEWLYKDKAHLILFYSDNISNVDGVKKVFEEFDEQFNGKVTVMFCDYTKAPKVQQFYQMNSLPGVLFMKAGKCYGNIVGPASKAKYQEIVKNALVDIMSGK